MARITFPQWTSNGRELLRDGVSVALVEAPSLQEATDLAQRVAALFHEDERRRAVTAAHAGLGEVAWATHKDEDPEAPILLDLCGVPGLTATISLGAHVPERFLLGAIKGLLDYFTGPEPEDRLRRIPRRRRN